jgi:tetratricopeptide (TPR) repeat protein
MRKSARPGLASLFLLSLLLLPSPGLGADARPLSRVEAEACRLVAAHLLEGPQTFWNATAAGSSLRKLGAAEGTREIEMRVGPRRDSEWELVTVAQELASSTAAFSVTFPSGIDDTMVFTMVEEGGVLRIADLRSLADPVAGSPAATPLPVASPVTSAEPSNAAGAVLAAFGVASLAAAGFTLRRRRVVSYVAAAVGMAACTGSGALLYMRHADDAASRIRSTQASVVPLSVEKSREVMSELRGRVAVGENVPSAEFQRAAHDDISRDRALVWRAQLDVQRNDLKAARQTLSRLKHKDRIPLAHLLEGRIAFLENREVDAVMALEKAMELGPERDDVLYETASILLTLGFDDRAEGYFRKLAQLGSREADAYYTLASIEAGADAPGKAEAFLLTAWRLRPELRASLIRAGSLQQVLQRPAVKALLTLNDSAEPLVTPPLLSERPLALPAGVSARVLGDHLEIDLGDALLRVPGGATIAPSGAAVLDSGAWEKRRAERAIGDVPTLIKLAGQPSSYAQPAVSRRIQATAEALVAHNRWADVIALTRGLSPSTSDLVPVDLLLMKALAHKRNGDEVAARALLTEMAEKPSVLKRFDAWDLLRAGEMLASVDSFDLAIRLMDRAGQLRELPHLDDRVRQLQLNRRLTTFSAHETTNFTIRYSKEDTRQFDAEKIGQIAEAELVRLKKWIPVEGFRKVVINVLSWETFRGTYTGSDHILGFYDGKITVPLAGIGMYPPEIVAILSHELAHAMIAQRTRDQAPRWFQEGLAQRIESLPYRRNPFNMYEPDQLIATAVLDDVITYSSDPGLIGEGYLLSQALIRYIEHRWGNAGLRQMLDSYAAGSTTEEALQRLSGAALPQFDRAYMEWGSTQHDIFENHDLVSYEEPEQGAIRLGRRR